MFAVTLQNRGLSRDHYILKIHALHSILDSLTHFLTRIKILFSKGFIFLLKTLNCTIMIAYDFVTQS